MTPWIIQSMEFSRPSSRLMIDVKVVIYLVKDLPLMFSFKNFKALAFIFGFLFHFELVFVSGVWSGSNLILSWADS